MKPSEIIDRFVEENGGNLRDALNVALTRLELATGKPVVDVAPTRNVTELIEDAIARRSLAGWDTIRIRLTPRDTELFLKELVEMTGLPTPNIAVLGNYKGIDVSETYRGDSYLVVQSKTIEHYYEGEQLDQI